MSLQAFGWAWGQQTGSPTRKAVLLSLANAHNGQTGRCDPSIAVICSDTELGPTAVKNALHELCEGDNAIITRKRKRRKDGSLGTYAYVFPGHLVRAPVEPPGDPGLGTPDDPRPETPGVPQNQEGLNQEGLNQGLALATRASAALSVTSQTITGEYVDEVRALGLNPPKSVVGQVARRVKALLDEGQDAADIRNALALMVERRLHPSTLDSLILEAKLGPGRRTPRKSALDADYERLRREAS